MRVGFKRQSILFLILLILVLFCEIHWKLVKVGTVASSSMEPTLYTGESVLYERLFIPILGIHRGDIVVINFPNLYKEDDFSGDAVRPLVKRVIGLPGEEIFMKMGMLRVIKNNHAVAIFREDYAVQPMRASFHYRLGKNQFFVAGDNRLHSGDSRDYGPVTSRMIIGIVRLKLN